MKQNANDKDNAKEIDNATALFSNLSPEAQDAVIDLIKCLLSEK